MTYWEASLQQQEAQDEISVNAIQVGFEDGSRPRQDSQSFCFFETYCLSLQSPHRKDKDTQSIANLRYEVSQLCDEHIVQKPELAARFPHPIWFTPKGGTCVM